MDPQHPAVTIEALLAHASWVERLARRLVLDPAGADDVVQAVWLESLERPPREARDLRGLAVVTRNVARRRARGEDRRRRREEVSARPEAVAGGGEVVARVELQRHLVDHVLALEEPYRSVILLRFFEGLSTRAMAQRLGRPPSTVQTQLQRALARLRERLDGDHGSRERWNLALLPLARMRDAAGSGSLSPFFSQVQPCQRSSWSPVWPPP